MKHADHQPVIVVRRHKGHHGHHGGAWKVAYADFVTAMMAFFLVLWLVSQDMSVKTAVAGYFRNAGVLPHEGSTSVMPGGRTGLDPTALMASDREPTQFMAEKQALAQAADRIKADLMEVPEFAKLRDQVEFSVTSEGLRIELVERTGSSFFDSGSAVLRGEAERILRVIAEEVGKLTNDVVVEGHTDSEPFVDYRRYSNWELSADRANAARRVMTDDGLRAGQLRTVRGFADMDLKIRDKPTDPRNRRISIVVRSQAAASLEQAVRSGVTSAPDAAAGAAGK